MKDVLVLINVEVKDIAQLMVFVEEDMNVIL